MSENIREIDESVSRLYEIKRRIGKGAYGIVWKAIDKKTKEVVAVKKIFDAFRNKTDAQRTYREIVFLRELRAHPNIVSLHNILRASNNKDIYLIFEYMETDLHNVIKHGEILRDIHKRFITYQLLKALKYIHSGNIIHRDLKPCNILLDSQCQCKVADFGLARSVSQLDNNISPSLNPSLTDYVATRWYRAPEILIASKKYTKGIDMWSVGCILAEMMLGKPLFPGSSTVNQVEKIMSTITPPSSTDIESVCSGYGSNLLVRTPPGPHTSLSTILSNAPPDSLDLISQLLIFNPYKRLTAIEALEHPYVAKFHNSQKEVTMLNPVVPPLCDNVQLSVDEYRNKLYEAIKGRRNSHTKHSRSAGELSHSKQSNLSASWVSTSLSHPVQSKLFCKNQSTELSNNEGITAKKTQPISTKKKPVSHLSRNGPSNSHANCLVSHLHHRHSLSNSQHNSFWKAATAVVKSTATATMKQNGCKNYHQSEQYIYKKNSASGDHNKISAEYQEQPTTECVKTSTSFQPLLKTAQKINVVRHMPSRKKQDNFSSIESPQKRKILTRQSAPLIQQSLYDQKYGYITTADLQELQPGLRW